MSCRQQTGHDKGVHFRSCLERIEGHLEREGADHSSVLPPVDVLLRVARREYKAINPKPTRAHQQVLKNVVKLLAEKVSPKEGSTLAMAVVQNAIHATEELALRAGYFVGLARGMAWKAQRGAEAVGRRGRRKQSDPSRSPGRALERAARPRTARLTQSR
jgi:hypothetical protein